MKTLTTLFSACALSLGMIGAASAQDTSSEHATHHPAPASASDPASKPEMAPGAGMMMNMEAPMQAMMADHMKSMSANGAGMQGCRQMMGAMMNRAGDTPPAADHSMPSPPKG